MNQVAREQPMVIAVEVECGFEGRFRQIGRAGWRTVQVNGIAQVYATALEAENAAYKALYASDLGPGIVSTGCRAGHAQTAAEERWKRIWLGKGRSVQVEKVKR